MGDGQKLGVTGLAIHDSKFPFIYRATVLDNDDPLQLGRIKAEVIPYFVGIDVDILPWAVPKSPMISGASDGTGSFAVPDIGSMVWVFFEMGDLYQPVYDGEAPDAVNGLPIDRIVNYPNRRLIKTSSGIEVYIDDSDTAISIVHPTGSVIKITKTGRVTIDGATDDVLLKSAQVDVDGNLNVYTGVTGQFTTGSGDVITVSNGIITEIN